MPLPAPSRPPPADLESLFIQSEEVRRELPEATQRFAKIDAAVRAVLADMAAARNCVACCNREGLLKHLEAQQGELELCEKVRRWGGGGGGGLLGWRSWMEGSAGRALCRGSASGLSAAAKKLPPTVNAPRRIIVSFSEPAWLPPLLSPPPLLQALADYIEAKRRAFPRFYFVSTADLLDILSNGNNPARIMQHMSKCFQVRWCGLGGRGVAELWMAAEQPLNWPGNLRV